MIWGHKSILMYTNILAMAGYSTECNEDCIEFLIELSDFCLVKSENVYIYFFYDQGVCQPIFFFF